MSTRGALAVIAAIVLGIGIVLALVPTSIDSDITCGSALAGADESRTSEAALADITGTFTGAVQGDSYDNAGEHVALCEDRVTTQRLIAFPIAGIGALALVFLALTAASKPVSEPLERSDPQSP